MCHVCVVDDVSASAESSSGDVCDIPDLHETRKLVGNISLKLLNEQTSKFKKLIAMFSDVFSEKLRVTRSIIHDIYLTSALPVHSQPYPFPHRISQAFDEEVKRMKDLGVIKPPISLSCSPVEKR